MRIANVLAGFSLAEADVLRKAVGKKDKELIQHELGRFAERAAALGHDRRAIDDIAAQIETFGRYGFNKSHAVAYSVLSYQTAWLKAHYTAEFMAALLSSQIGDTDTVVRYINEARELGLEVLPPRRERVGLQVHGGGRPTHPLRPRRDQERGRERDRVDPRGAADGRALSVARGAVRAHRPPALQQAGDRGADRLRRVRFPRRPPRATGGRPGQRAQRGAGSPGGAGLGSASAVRGGDPGPPAPGPASRRPSPVRARTAGARASRARGLHFRASPGPVPRRGGAFRDPHDGHAGSVERSEGPDRGGGDGGEATDLQEVGRRIRTAHARGLSRHGGGAGVPRSVGQAERGDPPGRGAAPVGRLQRARPRRGAGAG